MSGPSIQYTTYTPTTLPPLTISTTTPTTPTTNPTDPTSISPTTTHYQNHYPNVPITVPLAVPLQPTTSSYYSPYPTTTLPGVSTTTTDSSTLQFQQQLQSQQIQQIRQTNPAPARPPSPPEPAITPSIAQQAVQRLIENELIDVGFVAADSQSVRRLEVEVVAFVLQLFERAHEYSNLANRAGTIPPDLFRACTDFGLEPKELYPFARKRRVTQPPTSASTTTSPTPVSDTLTTATPSTEPTTTHQKTRRLKRKSRISPMKLTFSTSRSPSPDLLPSDDESGPPIIPTTLRGLPPYFPQLPPKHTYLQTPASPPKKAALPSLEKKLKTAGLVQESLKNLLLATEDSTGQEDAELLGHIVNWEMGLHPRKRWKVSGR